MKKTLKLALVLLLHVVFLSNLSAQDKPVTLGVRAGANLSMFHAKLVEGNLGGINSRAGFMVGVTADFALTEQCYILTGVDFASKGAREQRKGNQINVGAMYTMVPIHFGYKLKIDYNPTFLFRFGPYLGYGVAGKAKNTVTNEKVDTFQSTGYKKFDYGLGIGAGTEIPLEMFDRGAIVIEAGFNLGLADISEIGEKVKTRDLFLTLGYKF